MNDDADAAVRAAFERVWQSKWYVLGAELERFERDYAAFNQTRHCVGVANGLDALHLSLIALGIGPGDEVIVPSNTYIATWLAVSFVGATPVPVEPRADTYNLDPSRLAAALTSRTRAIMPVHLYGQACEMTAIQAFAQQHGLHIVEDNAQAQGATADGRLTGTWGAINGTSFYPGKNLGALGDGGAVTTDDDVLALKLRTLRNYGSQKKYYNEVIGYNSRLDEMQAAFLAAKLPLLPRWTQQRRAIADSYARALSPVAAAGHLQLPAVAEGSTHVYHLYVVRTANGPTRDRLQQHLTAAGVGTLIHYPVPPHRQQAYADLGIPAGSLPIAEQLAATCLSLPLYPGMTEVQIEHVGRAVADFFGTPRP